MAKMPSWQVGLLIAALSGGVAVACGGNDSSSPRGATGGSDTGGNGGDEANTGGRETATGGASNEGGNGNETSTGGVENAGGAGNEGGTGNETSTGGDTNTGGDTTTGGETSTGGSEGGAPSTGGDTSTGGTTSTTGIDDLIAATCDWEFGCCSAGETTYRLGTSGSSVDRCISDFVFQLHDSNQTDNPYPPGTATGLLGTLGFTVNLDRVVENPTGIQECIDAWSNLSCNTSTEPATHCEASAIPGEGACSLVNLFDPGLQIGDRCTLALTEGDGNDVECPPGSTCVDASDPDNPETFPTCVQRSTEGEPCTNDGDCDWNFYCSSSGDCTEKGNEGDACTFNDPANPVPNDEDAQCKAGLKCSPSSLTCVTNCALEYPCTSDFECPDGDSCMPTSVGDDSTSWHTCQPIGATASARCDDNADCVDSRRCAGGVCQNDLSIGDDCTTDEECEAGSFCDLAIIAPTWTGRTPTGQCTAYFNAQDPCFPAANLLGYSSGCNPATAPRCVSVDGSLQFECRSSLAQELDACVPFNDVLEGASDCAPGLSCEYVGEAATGYTCTSGADLGDACDSARSDGTNLTCGAGLFCFPATSTCVEQAPPGGDCEDPSTNAGENGLCQNGQCVDHWDGNGSFICTDAPVPVENLGDGLTCNG